MDLITHIYNYPNIKDTVMKIIFPGQGGFPNSKLVKVTWDLILFLIHLSFIQNRTGSLLQDAREETHFPRGIQQFRQFMDGEF